MSRILTVFALLFAGLSILTFGSYASPDGQHQGANDSSVQQVNPVVQMVAGYSELIGAEQFLVAEA